MGNPAEERPPPSVIGVPKLVPVVKPLARLADLVILPVAAGASCLHVLNGRAYLESKPMARILVIDDDPDMRAMLEQILKSAGHEVILAADGREGVERHCTSPADLVITDLFMPKQEGLETIREFRTRFPEVAIIAMSGKDAAVTMLSIAQKFGAVAVLHKPFLTGELITAVEKALGGQSPAQ